MVISGVSACITLVGREVEHPLPFSPFPLPLSVIPSLPLASTPYPSPYFSTSPLEVESLNATRVSGGAL